MSGHNDLENIWIVYDNKYGIHKLCLEHFISWSRELWTSYGRIYISWTKYYVFMKNVFLVRCKIVVTASLDARKATQQLPGDGVVLSKQFPTHCSVAWTNFVIKSEHIDHNRL